MTVRPINIAISPNLEPDDVLLAFKTLLLGAKRGSNKQIRLWFESFFGQEVTAFTFNSGRSAEWAILKAVGIGAGDEVLIQAFTCVAVPNSILWLKAKPVYVDIKQNTYNLDPQDLEKKITSKSKAVIVQHTFGEPANLEKIKAICKKHKLALIEDCAHSLGATYQGKKVGSFGAAAFFSLGRDKVVSSVFGGVAITRDQKLAKKLQQIHTDLPQSPRPWVNQQLLHPILTSLILPVYNFFSLGKVWLFIAQKLRLLSIPVYLEECSGGQPHFFPAQYSSKLATLGLNQLGKLERFNQHRKKIAKVYFKELKNSHLTLPQNDPGSIYLRFTIQTQNPFKLYQRAKKRGILLGNWYGDVVTPAKDYQKVGYTLGSCPTAEKVAHRVLNLPTYPLLQEKQAKKLAQQIKQWSSAK